MTKRERFLAFANFQPVDRVPRRADYIPSLREKITKELGCDPVSHFDMDTGSWATFPPPPGFKFPDYSVYHPGKTNGKDGFTIDGNGCGHQEHGFYHFTEYLSPLRDATSFAELEAYPIASNKGWPDQPMKDVCRKARVGGDYTNFWVGHMYENAWQIRGYEPFLMDLLTQREWAEYILDKFCENNVRSASAAAAAGADMISIGDDVANQNAMMFSPDVWREVMKPRWAKVIAAAKAIKPDLHVWYHSDGNISEIIDDIIEIGITILNPVQPECMDPLVIRKRYGKKLAFDGCVGTQTTFPFGSVEDMHKAIQKLGKDLGARNGGLMLSPTHVLEPEVPSKNVAAFFEACDKL